MTAVADTDEAHRELAHRGELPEVGSGRHEALNSLPSTATATPPGVPQHRREHHAQLDQITSNYTASH